MDIWVDTAIAEGVLGKMFDVTIEKTRVCAVEDVMPRCSVTTNIRNRFNVQFRLTPIN